MTSADKLRVSVLGVGPRGERRHGWRSALRRLTVVLVAGGGLACGQLADEGKLPPNVPDPASLHTPAGAMARYRGALTILPGVVDYVTAKTAILTDELAGLPATGGVAGKYTNLDIRSSLASYFDEEYDRLHLLRGEAQEARGFLHAYAVDSSPALAGHMYALEGYAEVFLADVFCSGIPLSTVDFDGDYTLALGSTTTDVYRHAVALFDSAVALTSDSARLLRFAAVGRGRALLALGRYAEAAAAVAAVPDDYIYEVTYTPPAGTTKLLGSFLNAANESTWYRTAAGTPSMGDQEGGNGLDYLSSGDPRTKATAQPQTDPFGNTFYLPRKSNQPIVVASGIEARLIEAEAALQANAADGQWLAKLNHLRQVPFPPECTGSIFGPPVCVPVTWNSPIDLADPGTDAQGTNAPRVDLMFRERAFWLYLTGHRQGDLRRLVREYLRLPDAVFPTGVYNGGQRIYGPDIVAPVPQSEAQLNPMYTGCYHGHA